MYEHATGEDPYTVPMRIAPAAHFTMGGLWADYDLMTSIPGLFVGGEAGWGYHGANRLGANSLLSATVDGWFVLPYSVPNYLAPKLGTKLPAQDSAAVQEALARSQARIDALFAVGGSRSPSDFHRELGEILYEGCGVERDRHGLMQALGRVRALREEFWRDVFVPGSGNQVNQTLEKAGRVADFLELGELMIVDALDREESCGAHYRVEYQTDGEAARNDEKWGFASAWQSQAGAGVDAETLDPAAQAANRHFIRHAEPFEYTTIHPETRSYA